MKIKTDFITNSSSTCYIVLIPNDFVIQDEIINDIIKTEKTWLENVDFPPHKEIKIGVSENIEMLKSGGDIWKDYINDDVIYGITEIIICTAGFVIKSIDIGPGEGIMQGIKVEKVMEILLNNCDLTKIFKITRNEDVK